MPIVVTAGDVAVYGESARRLNVATTAVGALAVDVASMLTASTWTGDGAAAAWAEAHRLASRLASASSLLQTLSRRAAATAQFLAAELARHRAWEASVLNDLGRVARLPGDLEIRVRAMHVPRVAWTQLPHTLEALLP